ncbi:MAG: Bacterial regulatory protein, Fis family [Candidatus Aminicenantes bacterium]|jgi:transcriptional regulator with GAF, ATPase, and Fis domain|nr:Bacterial regulatory protein, Fis family [Candidatus Aminicenantes bacterium]
MSRNEVKMKPSQDARPEESPYSNMARELVELYVRQVCMIDHLCLKKALDRLERDIILYVLSQTNGNQHVAAEILGLKANTLHYKLRRFHITPVHRFVPEALGKPH